MKFKPGYIRKLIMVLCIVASISHAYAQKGLLSKISGKRGLSNQFTMLDGPEQVPFNPFNARSIFGLNADADLVLKRTETDKLGLTHYRYYQTYNNIPVENSMYIAHTKSGKLTSVSGTIVLQFDSRRDQKARASVSPDHAIKAALNYVSAEKYAWQDANFEQRIKLRKGSKSTYYPVPSLTWYGGEDEIDPASLALAYKIDVYSLKPLNRKFIYVDAKTGKVLGTKQIMMHADAVGTAATGYSGAQTIHSELNGSKYRLRDITKGNGIITLHAAGSHADYTSTSANWTLKSADKWALDAHFGVAATWTFYKNAFNRNSIDNAGFALTSWVNDSSTANNAYWDGSEMVYGNVSSNGNGITSIDITGHEFTHGVTQFTCNLVYSKEPGAINESISDIMGKSVQFYTKPKDSSWVLGNDMGWQIRHFSNPNAYGQPDTYKGDFWTTDAPDNYGVHTNSGVGNYMFYLLVAGGAGKNDAANVYSVNGIGLTKADQIIYRTETVYLTSTSNYPDWRNACINAAKDLYGAASNEVTQVKNAWYAVGIGTSGDSSCNLAAPTDISTGNITNTSATISWAALPGATGYLFQWRHDSASTFTDTILTSIPFNLIGLTPGTTYRFQLSALCNGGDNGPYSTPDSITTTGVAPLAYCVSEGQTTDGVTNVTFNTINNTTSATTSGYTDYTSTQATIVNRDSIYLLSVKINTGGDYTNYAKAWIDWNQDGVFSIKEEEYNLGSGTNVTNGLTTLSPLSIIVPADAVIGTTRMRVSTQYDTEPSPCTASFDGEVEDYSVGVVAEGAPVCPTPSGLSSSALTNNTARLNWIAVPGAMGYQVQYKISGTATLITTFSATNVVKLAGLTAGTSYQFQVATMCSNSSISGYSSPVSFTTTGGLITYCASKGTGTYEYIKTVVLGTINHTVANDSGYGNYISIFTSLTAGATYTIKLTPGFTSGSYTEFYTVYVDYNQDGIFKGAGETVATGNGTGTGAKSLTFTVPAMANHGSTRIRIQMQYGSASTNPCAMLTSGDVHDYTVNITGPVFIAEMPSANTSANNVKGIQVFPNPVIGGKAATLSYHLSNDGPVTLNLVDMVGRNIRHVNLGRQNVGSYTY